MRLNPSKCELLCITNKLFPVKPTYCINNYHLQWVYSVKYLGVVVDSKLSWNDYTYLICFFQSDQSPEFIALSNMYTCQASSKQKAFKTLVLPVLDYECTVWNPHTQKNILALEKIQNRGAFLGVWK